MRFVKRPLNYSLAGVALLLLGAALWPVGGDPSKIQRGDPEARVLELLGRPDQIGSAPFYMAWGLHPICHRVNSGECVREYVYERSRSGCRESWYIGFDSRSNVVSNYRWSAAIGPTFTSR